MCKFGDYFIYLDIDESQGVRAAIGLPSQEIERLVHESNGLITYIEAVVAYCQDKEIELETVPKLLAKPLKERLKCEAQRLNYMKQSSKGVLPL